MSVRLFVGDERVAAWAPDDRGLAYGDGLFETLRAHRGQLPWWDAHWARLERGALRLGIVLPARARALAQAMELLDGADGVLKLLVTRGSGGRGYAPPAQVAPTWMLSLHPLPAPAPEEGIAVRWCQTRLASQPVLAGIKHCNRLEQVLARAEWNGHGHGAAAGAAPAAHEGLMRSTDGDVICATAANLFVLHGGAWATPALDRCGVEGVCRAWILEALQARQTRLSVTQVETADAVFLCNAVRGILPVARLGVVRQWAPHPQVEALRVQLGAAHAGFASS